MRHFIIDGYSLIRVIPLLKKTMEENQDAARELLIHSVGKIALQKKFRSTLVFDGSSPVAPKKNPLHAPVHVVFSSPATLSEYITRMIEQSKQRTLLTVITADKDLLLLAKKNFCQSYPSTYFANLLTEIEDFASEKTDRPLTPTQIKDWLKIFDAP